MITGFPVKCHAMFIPEIGFKKKKRIYKYHKHKLNSVSIYG